MSLDVAAWFADVDKVVFVPNQADGKSRVQVSGWMQLLSSDRTRLWIENGRIQEQTA
jgi:hypothetical protein